MAARSGAQRGTTNDFPVGWVIFIALALFALFNGGNLGSLLGTDAGSGSVGSGQTQQAPAVSSIVNSGLASVNEAGQVSINSAAVTSLLDGIQVKESLSLNPPKYDREAQFGGWADPDGNGCDARNDILARDLTEVAKEGSCKVVSGTLADPYTGKSIPFTYGKLTSSAVQIDHLIPLKAAWTSGADSWSQEKRVAFANDPINLMASDGPANGAKSDQMPSKWMPPNADYSCVYVAQVANVASTYQVALAQADIDKMRAVAQECGGA